MNKDNWLIIYRDVINYFNFENYISNNLNNEKSEPIKFRGFLVNNDWVDNWKKNSFYEEIKENIILKNIKNDNFISNFIMSKQLETKSNYDGILDIKNYIIPDNQIEEALKTDKSYALLNENFVSQFMNNSIIYIITFVLSYQKIEIKIKNKTDLSFQTNSNVIFNRAINYSNNKPKQTQIKSNIIPTNSLIQKSQKSNSNEINNLKNELFKANKIIVQQKLISE